MNTSAGAKGARKRGRRSGGRSGNIRGKGSAITQLSWSLPVNRDRPTEPLTEEGVQAVHDGAMRILEEIGIEFLNPEAADILGKAGCIVNGANVRAEFDAAGFVTRVDPCYGGYRTAANDDCLAPVEERAWSSPIFVDYASSDRVKPVAARP
jgi:trimethylamine:corrinoid methyltransferase-like protein